MHGELIGAGVVGNVSKLARQPVAEQSEQLGRLETSLVEEPVGRFGSRVRGDEMPAPLNALAESASLH